MSNLFVLHSFLLSICISSVAQCSLLGEDIVDRNAIQDLTGIGRVSVSGFVRCPFPPVLRNEPSLLAGTNVALTCNGERTVISDAVTDSRGFFEITFNALQTLLFHSNPCKECKIAVRGTSAAACVIETGRSGALLAPINCRHAIVEQENTHGNVVKYQAEPFYFDPTYN